MQDDSKPQHGQGETVPTLTDLVISGDPQRKSQSPGPNEAITIASGGTSPEAVLNQPGRAASPQWSELHHANTDQDLHSHQRTGRSDAAVSEQHGSEQSAKSVKHREIAAAVDEVLRQRLDEFKEGIINEVTARMLSRLSSTETGRSS